MSMLKELKMFDIIMPMCNLLEYSDNYADSSASLYQLKRDKQNMVHAGNPANVNTDNKSSITGNLIAAAGANGILENAKIIVPLKYLSNFFSSLEM